MPQVDNNTKQYQAQHDQQDDDHFRRHVVVLEGLLNLGQVVVGQLVIFDAGSPDQRPEMIEEQLLSNLNRLCYKSVNVGSSREHSLTS